ncbi:DUF3006 domain-containing protein [Caproiciproducens sp. LBM24188]|nr:DUF3006 domain-containing protein [Oscillospiraceae bacterium]HHV32522.1 DUF3006 domain-containing protein [Clostridiales bacterium]
MKYTIDRFEGEFAVVELENQQFVNIPRSAIPMEAKEGDILNVQVDHEETEKRRKHIQKLMDDVWAD